MPESGCRSPWAPACRPSGGWWQRGRRASPCELWIVVQNPGTRPASLTLNLLAGGTKPAVGTLTGVEIPAGGRRAFRVNDSLGATAASLLVTSSEPVVVERDQYRMKAPGLAMAAAIPLR